MTNEKRANILFGISALGFFGTFPFTGNFWGELAHSSLGAATVGGIADWLAIKALFEPIKGDKHSNLLYAKREQLIEAMVDFSTRDVLDKESVKEEIAHRDIVSLIIEYWDKRDGRAKVQNVLKISALKILNDIDLKSVTKKLTPHIRQCLKDHSLSQSKLPDLIQNAVENKNAEKFYVALLQMGKFIYNEPEFQKILKDDIHELVKSYLDGRLDRKIVRLFGHLASNGLSDDDILKYLNEWTNKELTEAIERPDNSYGAVKDKINQLFDSRRIWAEIQEKKNEFLDNADLEEWIYNNLQNYCVNRREELLAMLNSLLDIGMSQIKKNYKSVNEFLQEKLITLIEENYDELPNMIRNTINEKGDRYIVDTVKEKAGDNLNAIRISGTVIGAVVGAALFLLSEFLKGVCG